MPRGMALRVVLTSLTTITVTTSIVAGLCVVEIGRAPDTLDWIVALAGAVSGYLLMVGGWLLRFRGARRACAAEAESWQVLPLLGIFKSLRAPYLLLVAPSGRLPMPPDLRYRPGRRELQRVVWDPAINRLCPGDPVLVRRHGRYAVVDLPDGTRLWPAGTLRVREPKNWELVERPSNARAEFNRLRERARAGHRGAAGDLIRSIRKRLYLPATEKIDPLDPAYDMPPEPAATWPRPGYVLTLLAVGATGLGTVFGPLMPIATAIYAAGFAVHVWGWYGADPERARG